MPYTLNKDGTACWAKGSVVEVGLYNEEHDPNRYFAQCLTTGVWPTIQVLHDKYPEPLVGQPLDCPYAIWREVSEAEAQVLVGETRRAVGQYVVNPVPGGGAEVVYKTKVVETFSSLHAAERWLEDRVCSCCGTLRTKPARKGCTRVHFGDVGSFNAF